MKVTNKYFYYAKPLSKKNPKDVFITKCYYADAESFENFDAKARRVKAQRKYDTIFKDGNFIIPQGKYIFNLKIFQLQARGVTNANK